MASIASPTTTSSRQLRRLVKGAGNLLFAPASTVHRHRFDTRGAVYVEFLLAFVPLFMLFLGICQLVMLTVAHVIVTHAAVTAVRSAIVILEDQADDYGGAPLGSLSEGKHSIPSLLPLLEKLGAIQLKKLAPEVTESGSSAQPAFPRGPRMSCIRLAALAPLMILSPNQGTVTQWSPTLDRSLVSNTGAQAAFANIYAQAATAVTVHSNTTSEQWASEPLDPKGPVTVRITYLYYCSVPLVRSLMCHALSRFVDDTTSPTNRRWKSAANPELLRLWVPENARYEVVTAMATMPNQGADYLKPETGP